MRSLLRANRPAPRPRPSSGRLIVVEHGARGLDSFLSADTSDETALVAQGADDDPVELPFRIMGRIALIERAGRSIDCAVVVMAPTLEPRSRAARELIARTLHAHLRARGPGELVLAAPRAQADQRLELLTLVEALLNEHESSVTIRVQFHDDRPRSVASGTWRGLAQAHAAPQLSQNGMEQ